MTKTTQITKSGPILGYLPEPPDVATGLALVNRLQGHTTSEAFLPEGVWPELDEARTEQLRLRGQAVAILEERSIVLARHADEDKAHTETLKQAARDGATPPEDPRMPPEQRDRELTAINERLWATILIFAEHADSIIGLVRSRETEWLADLRTRLAPAQEKRRQAAALLEEAKAEEFLVHRMGRWVQSTADDEGFARQPAPKIAQVPERVAAEAFRDSLERPWHKIREWAAKTEQVPA